MGHILPGPARLAQAACFLGRGAHSAGIVPRGKVSGPSQPTAFLPSAAHLPGAPRVLPVQGSESQVGQALEAPWMPLSDFTDTEA